MQLERLRLREIRSYVSADLTLGPGTTLLAGDVGAGKTSLLHAIEMALFGFAEVDAGYLVRHRAERAEVALTLAEGEHRYTLERRFRRIRRKGQESFKVDENSLREDGSRTLYSVTELKRRAIDLLGFPDNPNPRAHSDLWRWAVYVPQEQMREILLSGPEERLSTVRKALGVEQYATARDNAEALAHSLRREAVGRTQEAERLHVFEEELQESRRLAAASAQERERLRTEESAAAQGLAQAREAAEKASVALRRVEADRRELTLLSERAEALARRHREHAEMAERREAASRQLTADQGALPPFDPNAEERARADLTARRTEQERSRDRSRLAEEALRALVAAEAEQRGAAQARAEARAARERAQAAAARTQEELKSLESAGPVREPVAPTPRTLEEIAERLRSTQSALDALAARHGRLAHEMEEMESLQTEGVCPRCHRPVDPSDFRQSLGSTRSELEEVRRETDRTAAERSALEAERGARERFERAHDRWSRVQSERSTAAARLRRAAEEVDRAVAAEQASEAALDAAEGRRASLQPARESAARASATHQEAEAAVEAASAVVVALERLAERRRSLEERRRLLQAESTHAVEERARLGEEQAQLDSARGAVAARLADADALSRAASELETEERRWAHSLESARTALARVDAELSEAGRRAERAERGVADRHRLLAEAQHVEALADFAQGPLREGLLTLERQVLARAHVDFDRLFARYFATLVDDPGLTARTDPTFQAAAEIDGEWTPPEALSGGERTALALAYRLALGQVVRASGRLRLETLILDEPTDGFSPEQVQRMGDLLEELAIPQVLIVSHEVGLSAIADRVLQVAKTAGESRILDPSARAPEPEEPAPERPPRRARRPRVTLGGPEEPPAAHEAPR